MGGGGIGNILSMATLGLPDIIGKAVNSDTIKAMTGRETSAEKEAKGQQQASLLAAKTESDTALNLRKSRMAKKSQGRGSLLTGTELGIQEKPLSSTLG